MTDKELEIKLKDIPAIVKLYVDHIKQSNIGKKLQAAHALSQNPEFRDKVDEMIRNLESLQKNAEEMSKPDFNRFLK